jgi:hypothetical protein
LVSWALIARIDAHRDPLTADSGRRDKHLADTAGKDGEAFPIR